MKQIKKKEYICISDPFECKIQEKLPYAIVFNFDLKLEKYRKNKIKETWANPDDWNFITFMEAYCNRLIKGSWKRLGKYFYFDNVDDVLWIKLRYDENIKKILNFKKLGVKQ